jgi:hypothetical protein
MLDRTIGFTTELTEYTEGVFYESIFLSLKITRAPLWKILSADGFIVSR